MNYYVLYHVQNKTDVLLKRLKEIEFFTVLYPKYEHYRRDRKSIESKPSFPGYVFVKTELDQDEFDEILYSMDGRQGLFKQIRRDGLPALTKEETAFFELFYDEEGILRMSYGRSLNKRIVVEQGPLMNLERYIIKYDKHNKIITLEISILDRTLQCGFIEMDES